MGWAINADCRSEPFLAPPEAEIPLSMMCSVKFVKSLAWWPSGSLRGGGAKWMQWRAARGQPEPRELPGVTHSTARICGAQYGYRQLALFVFLEKLPGHKQNLANITLRNALYTGPRASSSHTCQ